MIDVSSKSHRPENPFSFNKSYGNQYFSKVIFKKTPFSFNKSCGNYYVPIHFCFQSTSLMSDKYFSSSGSPIKPSLYYNNFCHERLLESFVSTGWYPDLLTLKTCHELIKLVTWDSTTNVFDPSRILCKATGKTAALCKLIKCDSMLLPREEISKPKTAAKIKPASSYWRSV